EEVSEESFKCLTQSMIEKLIPKTGPQAVFLKRWNSEFRKSNNSELSGAESSSSQKEIDVKTKSQVVTIETCDPIINLEDTLKRCLFRSGNLEHPLDQFSDTTVEILLVNSKSIDRNRNDVTEDGYVIIGNIFLNYFSN
ncbi:hypothetical protein HCN44_001789, partial [Aphidius gifuensis]